jgi:predicted alpha/beta hydrolase family esterase
VASEDDPFVSLARARYFAEKWGSEFTNIGAKGHINSDSNLGIWAEGQLILKKMPQSIAELRALQAYFQPPPKSL